MRAIVQNGTIPPACDLAGGASRRLWAIHKVGSEEPRSKLWGFFPGVFWAGAKPLHPSIPPRCKQRGILENSPEAVVDCMKALAPQGIEALWEEGQVNQPVLVLNANYEPLNICTTRRAIGLMLTGKAEMILNGRGVIRTPSVSFPRPSIVRLSYMVHRPHDRVKLTKRELFRRDNYTCQYCGRRGSVLTIDHVIPRHRGGMHAWDNLVTACPACNRRKGGRTPHEAGMPLRTIPREPRPSAEYIYGYMLEANREWADYIRGW